MRIVLAVIATCSIAGCASVEQLRAQAASQPDYAVCEKMITGMGPIRGVAAEEAQRRHLDCNQHAAPILANQQQQTQTGLQLLQMSRPQPQAIPFPAPSPSVICTSRPGPGGTATTTCL